MDGDKKAVIWLSGKKLLEVSMGEVYPKARQLVCVRLNICVCARAFVYRFLVYVPFRATDETIAPTGSAAGQKQSKKRVCVETCRPSFSRSWHLLLVHSRRVKGQRGSCSKLSDGLKGLVD